MSECECAGLSASWAEKGQSPVAGIRLRRALPSLVRRSGRGAETFEVHITKIRNSPLVTHGFFAVQKVPYFFHLWGTWLRLLVFRNTWHACKVPWSEPPGMRCARFTLQSTAPSRLPPKFLGHQEHHANRFQREPATDGVAVARPGGQVGVSTCPAVTLVQHMLTLIIFYF